MQDYDIALKDLFRDSHGTFQCGFGGSPIVRWLPSDLPKIRMMHADLLGRTAAGGIVHFEFQSTNDPKMALRMAEYNLQIYRNYDQFARQVVLYVGRKPMQMRAELSGAGHQSSYALVDMRTVDGERLLTSGDIGDNVLAVLARLDNARAAVKRMVVKIARQAPKKRAVALRRLLILAGLRDLEAVVEQEARKMPILNDIMDHKVLGREIKRGIELGIEQGIEQGHREGEVAMLRRQIRRRFGRVPRWAGARLAQMTAAQLENTGIRILDASTIESLFE